MVRILLTLTLLACSAQPAPPAAATHTERADTKPPPADLAAMATKFGLDMSGDFVWTKIDKDATRFDWSGHPANRDDVEVLWSFWMEKMGATETKFLPSLATVAAADLIQNPSVTPQVFEQPDDIVHVFGYDRVVTACFPPFEGYGKGKKHGVMHAIVKNGSLSVVAIFSNDRTGVVPIPRDIGARGHVATP